MLYPTIGPFFFVSFVFLGIFVLLNMFLAIINESYASVKETMAKEKPELMLGDFFSMKYGKLTDKVNTHKHSQILDADEVLRKEEILAKDEIDFASWRTEMKVKLTRVSLLILSINQNRFFE